MTAQILVDTSCLELKSKIHIIFYTMRSMYIVKQKQAFKFI